ncbi:lymphocyte cytosolic protein 2 isoform X2 [Myxocyprinus asiaticus]|uniref:lymphocyte cytosolic protein 2 isoform X2 n=1 Tax=Myxocyprinus asiaticus TaxID=70543 RepID=UPI0022219594|nr:lymphocyte cytosolic protein 2 isoform X2 [Myxocyprinus asiaticus]
MSTESLPTKSEVMGWNCANLADYLKKMRLLGCDRVVKKSNMSGARFLNMTDKELKKFPTAHIPYITKICKDINQTNKQRKNPFNRSEHLMPPNQEPNVGGWDSDEFDQEESDSEYEQPDNNDHDDNYICAASRDLEEEVNSNDDYEPPPAEITSDIPSHFRVAKPLGDGDYLDSAPRGSCDRTTRQNQDNRSASLPRVPMNISKPPSRLNPSPQRPFVPPTKPDPAVPVIDRSKKPGLSTLFKNDTGRPARSNPLNVTNSLPMASKAVILPNQICNSQQWEEFPPPPIPSNVMMEQGMDPQWYVGQMKRGESELSLRQVNKDGTFLVRDSSKGGKDQPYTLMVLHQQKVYNIQIRCLGNNSGYSLGTGLNGIERLFSRDRPLLLKWMGEI